jgi:small subunit ribosomal protein S1
VKVLDIDRDRQRISLGLKQTQADPWQSVVEAYQVGDIVAGKVTKVVTFGAFVEIHAGVEGLVHISELAEHHVENPREVVQPDQDVAVRIIEIDGERRRLSLSLKRASDVSIDENANYETVYSDEAGIAPEDAEEAPPLEGAEAEAAAAAEAAAVVEVAVEEAAAEEAAAEEAAAEVAVVEEASAIEEAAAAEAPVADEAPAEGGATDEA